MKSFEIWQSHGDCIETSVCPAGVSGDWCRALNAADAKLVHVFEAYSELDQMQKYYDFMGFGVYHSEWPDLAMRPYHWIEGLENLRKLNKPLLEAHVMGDGTTRSNIPDPMPRIVVQDSAVLAVDVWVRDEFGGVGEGPLNEADLIVMAQELLRRELPHVLERERNTFFVCPLDIAEQMQWRADGRDPEEAAKIIAATAMPSDD